MQKTASEELSIQDLSENLAAAGCDEALIREWIQLHQNHELLAQLQLLQRHRQSLLDSIHHQEHQICCLDYLVYRLEKNDVSTEGGNDHEPDSKSDIR